MNTTFHAANSQLRQNAPMAALNTMTRSAIVLVADVAGWVRSLAARMTHRRAVTNLHDLPDYLLSDIGLNRTDLAQWR